MRTRKQIEAARRNGAKSQGPATPEGKARSSRNALKHGLTSHVVVLATEDPAEFQRLLDCYLEQWHPADQIELDLVHDIAAARWRLNRTIALEAALLDLEMDRQRPEVDQRFETIPNHTRAALAYAILTERSRALQNLSRTETRLRRAIQRATLELELLQSQHPPLDTNKKRKNEPGNAQPQRPHRIAPTLHISQLTLRRRPSASPNSPPPPRI